jgi:K+-transporting ATPase KdpF subunit
MTMVDFFLGAAVALLLLVYLVYALLRPEKL